MIHESYHWKHDLARDAGIIERWCGKRPTERQGVLLERKTFLSAYAVRKLIESHKLTDELRDSFVKAIRYPKNTPTKRFRHLEELEVLYDFEQGTKCTLSVKNLVNTVIHSLHFGLVVGDDNADVTGFLVTSDHREKHLWYVAYADFVAKLRAVSADYPTAISVWFDEDGQEQRSNGMIPSVAS